MLDLERVCQQRTAGRKEGLGRGFVCDFLLSAWRSAGWGRLQNLGQNPRITHRGLAEAARTCSLLAARIEFSGGRVLGQWHAAHPSELWLAVTAFASVHGPFRWGRLSQASTPCRPHLIAACVRCGASVAATRRRVVLGLQPPQFSETVANHGTRRLQILAARPQ